MKLHILNISLLLCTLAASQVAYSASDNIFNKVSGIWGWEKPGLDCKALPSNYKFSDSNKAMSITSIKKQPMHDGTTRDVVNYKVISNDISSITLAMENETRLDKNGNTALWKIILVNNDKFFWQISGDPNTQWGPVIKCGKQ